MTNGHEGLKGSFIFYRITREELRIYVFRCIRIRTESLQRRNGTKVEVFINYRKNRRKEARQLDFCGSISQLKF